MQTDLPHRALTCVLIVRVQIASEVVVRYSVRVVCIIRVIADLPAAGSGRGGGWSRALGQQVAGRFILSG
jgi:hypothetical protein